MNLLLQLLLMFLLVSTFKEMPVIIKQETNKHTFWDIIHWRRINELLRCLLFHHQDNVYNAHLNSIVCMCNAKGRIR